MCAAWEEDLQGEGEEASPLLGKSAEKQRSHRRKSTVAILLSFSARDFPLLLLAFLAGGYVLGFDMAKRHASVSLRLAKVHFVTEIYTVALCGCAGAAAALGQALIPYYTGMIIDYASIEPYPEGFQGTCIKLVLVALGCAVFTGIRGGLFTVGMTRLNVRIRTHLFDALMKQELAFVSSTKTGETQNLLHPANNPLSYSRYV